MSPRHASPEWKAILTYMDSLRPRPNPHRDGPLPRLEIRQAARRGREIFFHPAVGCGRCHCGPRLTISGTDAKQAIFDVGTGKALDVPSLLHLWDTAPYLHDGRAATLHDVLTVHNEGDRHGTTSHLNARELDDLVTFMLAAGGEAQR
jgi:cytochrome c peroxidase